MNSFEAMAAAQLLAIEGQRQIVASLGAAAKATFLRVLRALANRPVGTFQP